MAMMAGSHYRAAHDLEGAGRATALAAKVLDRQGESEGARSLLEAMAEELDRYAADGPTRASAAAAQVREQLATVLWNQGRYTDMLQAADQAGEVARVLGDDSLLGRAEERRGTALNSLGRIGEAREALERAVMHMEQSGDMVRLNSTLSNLAESRRLAGDLLEARRLTERALELAIQTGIDHAEMSARLNLAEILLAMRELDRARQQIERAEEIERAGAMAASPAPSCPYHRGELALRYGRLDEAEEQLRRAIARAAGINRYVSEMGHTRLAEVHLLQGSPEDAQRDLAPLLEDEVSNLPLVLATLAWARVELGENIGGLELAQRAEDIAHERQILLYLPETLYSKGMALVRLGRMGAACDVFEEGLARARAMPQPHLEARFLDELEALPVGSTRQRSVDGT